MNAVSSTAALMPMRTAPTGAAKPVSQEDKELRGAFDSMVGETFYGQMMKSMRKSVGKSPYFHGGRAEEIFQQQFDQIIAQKMSSSSSSSLTDSMYELFTLRRP